MNITLKYGDAPVSCFNELLDKYPLNQFNSPRRSTVPLLAYWKNNQRCRDFLWHLDIEPQENLTLSFEYEVPVQAGRGYPSCTDLMIESDRLVLAVEAKYTEPDYEIVCNWLRDPPQPNRIDVLEGWLALINQTTGSQIKAGDVLGIAYQTIHRAASACFPLTGEVGVTRFIVYQMFDVSDKKVKKIVNDLAALNKMMPSTALHLACLAVPTEKKPAFNALAERWDRGMERNLSHDVVAGLRENSLFEFAELITCSVME